MADGSSGRRSDPDAPSEPGGGRRPRPLEAELRAVEERFKALVEAIPAVVYESTLEDDGQSVYMSPRGAELYGLPLEELSPARVRELIHPDDRDRVVAEIRRANESLLPLTVEYRIIRPDGTLVWVENSSVVLASEEGEPPKAQGYVLDISERKRLEEQLLQAQKMDAVGQLAGGIAHDFNNILTAIQGYAEFALDRADGDVELREDLLEILKASDRAATMTAQILAFGRRQVLRARPLDLNAVIDDTRKLLLRLIGAETRIASRLEVPLWSVHADPGQLTQVLVNLAVNARDAMPGGGRLLIETANTSLRGADADAVGLEPGEYVTLAVADTGSGMDELTSKRAFEPFFTTKPVGAGSGLGLSTVYGIVRQSGGAIAVDTAPGAGTTIRIHLPRTHEEPEPASSIEPPAPVRRARGTVLIAEDEPVIRRLVTEMLTRGGYDVLIAGGPREAVELATAASSLDLLVSDVVMPGMSGPQLAALLREDRPDLRVLFISGYPGEAIVERRLLEDDAVVLRKPFAVTELLTAVAALVEQR